MNVTRVINNRINGFQETEPILIDELTKDFMGKRDAVYVAINRLVREGIVKSYAKGVYYKPRKTRFGEIGIDKRRLVQKKYLLRNDESIKVSQNFPSPKNNLERIGKHSSFVFKFNS